MKKNISEGIKVLRSLIKENGLPRKLCMRDTKDNREFAEVISTMKEFKDIEIVFEDNKATMLAHKLREVGEFYGCNIGVDY